MAVNITPQSQLTVGAPNQGEAHNTNVSRANANDQALADAVSSLTGAGLVRTVTVGSAKLSPDGSGNVTLPGGVVFAPMTTSQRDAIASPTIGQGIYNTTLSRPEMRSASGWVPLSCLIEVFTASSTWTKAPGARVITAIVFGGGTSGSAVVATNDLGGTPGGQGARATTQTLPATAFPATVSVTVGAGGARVTAGPTGVPTAGSPGGTSSFGPVSSPATTPTGLGAGSGGSSTRASGGGIQGNPGSSPVGTTGTARSGTGVGGDGGSGGATGQDGYAPGGGGGAGCTSSTNSDSATSGAGARGEVIVITYF